jgi:hypothetical protein
MATDERSSAFLSDKSVHRDARDFAASTTITVSPRSGKSHPRKNAAANYEHNHGDHQQRQQDSECFHRSPLWMIV